VRNVSQVEIDKCQNQWALSYLLSLCVPCVPVIYYNLSSYVGSITGQSVFFRAEKKLTFGTRAFVISVLMCWNLLPLFLKLSSLLPEQFRRELKTTLMVQLS